MSMHRTAINPNHSGNRLFFTGVYVKFFFNSHNKMKTKIIRMLQMYKFIFCLSVTYDTQ